MNINEFELNFNLKSSNHVCVILLLRRKTRTA